MFTRGEDQEVERSNLSYNTDILLRGQSNRYSAIVLDVYSFTTHHTRMYTREGRERNQFSSAERNFV